MSKPKSTSEKLLFCMFLVSGFCSLLYQLIWVRLAYASFGVIMPVLSVVVSIFMLGLSLGSWAGGKFILPLTRKTGISAIIFYAVAELLIGLGAFLVPSLFIMDGRVLLQVGQISNFGYLFNSALLISISILPWCFLMGTTFPLAMAFVREKEQPSSETSFSFLYTANVLGAMLGAFLTAFVLIELWGFKHTLLIAACLNFCIALIAICTGLKNKSHIVESKLQTPLTKFSKTSVFGLTVLFLTGFCSMAMEIVWTRTFTPVLGTAVYSFAALLLTYLYATCLGAYWYRGDLGRGKIRPIATSLGALAITSVLPVLLNDPRINMHLGQLLGLVSKAETTQNILNMPLEAHAFCLVIALLSVFPFCYYLGYLTPSLIDSLSAGQPDTAGKAYATNTIGCILGPLFASYVILPLWGAKISLLLLALPFLLTYLFNIRAISLKNKAIGFAMPLLLFAVSLLFIKTYEDPYPNAKVYRDHTATVIAFGSGLNKNLLVNGVQITFLTRVTKYMAHLPLAFHTKKPESALVICFGMGTTYRSLLSWNIQVDAVELVPSVKAAFEYFHADADSILSNPKGQIIIDDGRRYLQRTDKKYDLIIMDPPPPVPAAGSSLLYAEEFYRELKRHLKPGGIVQQWLPGGDRTDIEAVTRSLVNEFPYVRVFPSIEGWGYHFLASLEPIPKLSADDLIARLPNNARIDLGEWTKPNVDIHDQFKNEFDQLLSHEIPVDQLLNKDPAVKITDNHPMNEYFMLRMLKSAFDNKALAHPKVQK